MTDDKTPSTKPASEDSSPSDAAPRPRPSILWNFVPVILAGLVLGSLSLLLYMFW